MLPEIVSILLQRVFHDFYALINISQLLRTKGVLYMKNGCSSSCDSDIHDRFTCQWSEL